MDIELLLAHPKQNGGGSLLRDLRGRPMVIHHFQLEKFFARYGSGHFSGLERLADAVCGKSLSEASTDLTDSLSFSNSSVCKVDDDNSSDLDEARVKPKRKRANAHQLELLKKTFQQTPFPNSEARKRLAKDLGMTPRSVQIWFQNQRQIARNLVPVQQSNPESDS